MKKNIKKTPQDEQVIEMLKKLTSRVEDATIDISSIKSDLKFVNLRLSGVEHNTDLMKVDMESIKNDMEGLKADAGGLRSKIEGAEERLHKRIEHVADLITIEFGGKIQNHEKRIQKLEHVQQVV